MTAAPNAIAVVKLSALGDVVHATPVVEALACAFPAARLVWVVERREVRSNPIEKKVAHGAELGAMRTEKAFERFGARETLGLAQRSNALRPRGVLHLENTPEEDR